MKNSTHNRLLNIGLVFIFLLSITLANAESESKKLQLQWEEEKNTSLPLPIPQSTSVRKAKFHTWIVFQSGKTLNKGHLHQLGDSTIRFGMWNKYVEPWFLENPESEKDISTINVSEVYSISFRKKSAPGIASGIGFVIGFGLGAVIGAIAAYVEAENRYTGPSESLYTIVGGLIGGAILGLIGFAIGSAKKPFTIKGSQTQYNAQKKQMTRYLKFR